MAVPEREASPVAITHRPVPTTRTAKDSSEVIIRVRPPWAARRVPRRTTRAMTGRVASSRATSQVPSSRAATTAAPPAADARIKATSTARSPGRSRHWSESSSSAARLAARRPIWRVLSSGPALQRQAPSGPPGRQSVSTGSRAGLRAPGMAPAAPMRRAKAPTTRCGRVRRGARASTSNTNSAPKAGARAGSRRSASIETAPLCAVSALSVLNPVRAVTVHLPGRAEPRVARCRWRATAAGPDRSRPARARGGRPARPRASRRRQPHRRTVE